LGIGYWVLTIGYWVLLSSSLLTALSLSAWSFILKFSILTIKFLPLAVKTVQDFASGGKKLFKFVPPTGFLEIPNIFCTIGYWVLTIAIAIAIGL